MSIEIRYVNAKKSSTLDELVTGKLTKLTDRYNWITNAVVFLKEEKHPEHKNFECEIQLSVPGPQIFASHHDENFTKAINTVIHELSAQLEKKKSKMTEHR